LAPDFFTVLIAAAMLVYGPIHQPLHYHEFAHTSTLWGIPNAADVLSNIGFALVGSWDLAIWWKQRDRPQMTTAWQGYGLFMGALILTAIGSSFYHWAPDNARLVWDRLPIALACARKRAAMICAHRLEWRWHWRSSVSPVCGGGATPGSWVRERWEVQAREVLVICGPIY